MVTLRVQPSIFIVERKEGWLHSLNSSHRQTRTAEAPREVVQTQKWPTWWDCGPSIEHLWCGLWGHPVEREVTLCYIKHQRLGICSLILHTMVSWRSLRAPRGGAQRTLASKPNTVSYVMPQITSLSWALVSWSVQSGEWSLPCQTRLLSDWTKWDAREGSTL